MKLRSLSWASALLLFSEDRTLQAMAQSIPDLNITAGAKPVLQVSNGDYQIGSEQDRNISNFEDYLRKEEASDIAEKTNHQAILT